MPQGSLWIPRQGAKSDPGMEAMSGVSIASFNRAVPAAQMPDARQTDVDKEEEWIDAHETIFLSLREKADELGDTSLCLEIACNLLDPHSPGSGADDVVQRVTELACSAGLPAPAPEGGDVYSTGLSEAELLRKIMDR